jgi:hypothetical protein
MSEKVGLKAKTSENKGKESASKPKENFYESMDSPVEQILHLQRTIGNQAVQRLIKSGTIQAKLKIGKPNDKYEQEADRMAEKIMSMPEPKGSSVNGNSSMVNGQWSLGEMQTGSPSVQRQSICHDCPEREEIQTKPLAGKITPLVQRQAGKDEEEPVQTKRIQRQENEEEKIQTKLQRQVEEEEEERVQTKRAGNQASAVTSNIEFSVNSLKGGVKPHHVTVFSNRGNIRLEGRTDAYFNNSSFRTTNVSVRQGEGCEGCSGSDCVHAKGNLVATYSVTTNVTLPRVSDYEGLSRCQQRRVQNAIDTILAPHEQEHVAAFKTYNGTARSRFDLTICRSEFDSTIKSMFESEESARRSAAKAASDRLDPFYFDVDLNCEDNP